MGNFPNAYQKGLIRATFPAGTRIRLIRMDDPWTSLKPGDTGTVKMVDDAGQIHMKWDNGSELALIYGEDKFEVMKG